MVCDDNENIINIVCQGFNVHMIVEKLMMPFLFFDENFRNFVVYYTRKENGFEEKIVAAERS